MSHPIPPPSLSMPVAKLTPTTPGVWTSAKTSGTQPGSTQTLASPSVSANPTVATPSRMSPPPLPGAPSPAISSGAHHQKSTLIPHIFARDGIIPRLGQLIKIRLDQPLAGPGSSQVSTSAPTRATMYNYHSAIVLYIRSDVRLRCFTVTVFPIPAYTGARLLGTTSQAWVAQLLPEKSRELIPMPFVGCTEAGLIDTIPEGFGGSVRPMDALGNMYADRVPSWILVDEHVVRVPWTTVWKSFNPDVRFTNPDVDRLQDYATRLQVLTQTPTDVRVNMLHIHDECTHPRGVFEELFGDFQGVIHYLSEDGKTEQEEIEAQGDEYPEVPGLLELLQMIGTGDEGLKRWIGQEEERVRREKEIRVQDWLTAPSETTEFDGPDADCSN